MKTPLCRHFATGCILLLVGCASVGNNFDESKSSETKKGQTTETDLVRMFGEPQNRTMNSDSGLTLTWMYSEAKVKGDRFVPYAGAFRGAPAPSRRRFPPF